jgi:hypothetical protein
MKTRHLVAGGVIAVLSVVGTAGVAAAQTSTNPATPNKQALCEKATARLPKVNDRIMTVEQRVTTLQQRLADAQAKHQDDRATFIQQRIDWGQTVHDHLVSIVNQINARCGTT